MLNHERQFTKESGDVHPARRLNAVLFDLDRPTRRSLLIQSRNCIALHGANSRLSANTESLDWPRRG
jgi:hypothetical protein